MARPPRKSPAPPEKENRNVTPEEAALWDSVMGETQPLPDVKRTRRKPPGDAKPPAAPAEPESAQGKPAKEANPAVKAPPANPPVTVEQSGEMPAGRRAPFAGLDRRNAQRLRRGQMPIDARLDLHGMTRDAAHGALIGFLRSGAERGHRCVLVITGKGAPRGNDDAGFMPNRSAGILRAEVPRWLGEAALKPQIIAWTPAIAKHGGSGALYVLLRRKRAAT